MGIDDGSVALFSYAVAEDVKPSEERRNVLAEMDRPGGVVFELPSDKAEGFNLLSAKTHLVAQIGAEMCVHNTTAQQGAVIAAPQQKLAA